MCYKVTISKKARDDLVKLTTYLAVDCAVPITAERQRNRILEGIESLKQFPYRCKCFLTKEKFQGIEFRTLILDPWQVIFVIDEKSKTVDIVRILSSRMDLPSHLQKQFSLSATLGGWVTSLFMPHLPLEAVTFPLRSKESTR